MTGGAPVSLAPASNLYGASWAEDGMIYYGQGPEGIWRVPENGGEPKNVISMDSGQLAHGPQLLPGGEWVLFTEAIARGWNEGSIVAESLVDDERKVLIEGGTEGRYVPTGHIVYVRDGTLFAVPFDLGAMEVTSGPTSMVEGIRTPANDNTGAANYALTSRGGLVYVPVSGAISAERTLVWVDREGNPTVIDNEMERDFRAVRLSPDGRQIAVEIFDGRDSAEIWLYGIESGTWDRLTNVDFCQGPLWTPGGERVLFYCSSRQGNVVESKLYWKPADFSGEREELLATGGGLFPISWSKDGELVLHEMIEGEQRRRILVMAMGEDRTPFSLLDDSGQYNQRSPMVSPDGRWVAYVESQSGQDEVYVRPFPGAGRRISISRGAAFSPMWGRDESELFYRSDESMMVAHIETEPEFQVVERELLFPNTGQFIARVRTVYDYDRRNDRFLVAMDAAGAEEEPSSPRINVILNWFEELKERVPTGGQQ